LFPFFDKIYKSDKKHSDRMPLGEYATWMLLQDDLHQ